MQLTARLSVSKPRNKEHFAGDEIRPTKRKLAAVGLEPTPLAGQDPKSCVSANFTKRPLSPSTSGAGLSGVYPLLRASASGAENRFDTLTSSRHCGDTVDVGRRFAGPKVGRRAVPLPVGLTTLRVACFGKKK